MFYKQIYLKELSFIGKLLLLLKVYRTSLLYNDQKERKDIII